VSAMFDSVSWGLDLSLSCAAFVLSASLVCAVVRTPPRSVWVTHKVAATRFAHPHSVPSSSRENDRGIRMSHASAECWRRGSHRSSLDALAAGVHRAVKRRFSLHPGYVAGSRQTPRSEQVRSDTAEDWPNLLASHLESASGCVPTR